MQPFIVAIGTDSKLLVLPDSEAHVDGHPILTYTYSLFKSGDSFPGPDELKEMQAVLRLSSSTNEDYLGYITIELPDKVFTNTPNEKQRLTTDEVEELLEGIGHIRDTPAGWPKTWVTGN